MKLIIDIPDGYKDLLPNIQNGSITCKIILDAVKNGVSYEDRYYEGYLDGQHSEDLTGDPYDL